jgi:hypothetical protein
MEDEVWPRRAWLFNIRVQPSLRDLLKKPGCAQQPGIKNSLVDYHGKEWKHWW